MGYGRTEKNKVENVIFLKFVFMLTTSLFFFFFLQIITNSLLSGAMLNMKPTRKVNKSSS